MSLREITSNDNTVATVGVAGVFASWTLSGTLSLLATICTLIVVGPKAWDQLMVWRAKYEPKLRGLFKRK